jgi:hypothetical protein
MIPYFGVFPLVFIALNKAFSAPIIYIVEAEHLAKLIRDPALAISLAAITSPTTADRFGATVFILFFKYSSNFSL